MNPGQEQFLEFMVERAQDGKADAVKGLLFSSFEQQKVAPLTRDGFEELKGMLLEIMKPEAVAEVTKAMEHFGKNLA